MRFALLVSVLMLSVSLSGCMEFFLPQDDIDSNGTEANQAPPESDDTTGTLPSEEDNTGAGSGGDGGDGGDGGGGDTGNGEDEEPAEPEIAPPKEQRQDSVDDVDRPGEYALLDAASKDTSVTTDVPTWNQGARWTFRSNVPLAAQTCEYRDTVMGSGDFFEVGVYHVDRLRINCGERSDEKEEAIPRGHADLMEIEDDGYIEHELVFPLEDGKRWLFHRRGNVTVTAELDYIQHYVWDNKIVDAWHVTLEYSTENVRVEKWYGIDAEHYLREEIHAKLPTSGWTMVSETTLQSYQH